MLGAARWQRLRGRLPRLDQDVAHQRVAGKHQGPAERTRVAKTINDNESTSGPPMPLAFAIELMTAAFPDLDAKEAEEVVRHFVAEQGFVIEAGEIHFGAVGHG